MNRRKKFDVASFILGGEIRKTVTIQKQQKTVTDISTLCPSACVHKKSLRALKAKNKSIDPQCLYVLDRDVN